MKWRAVLIVLFTSFSSGVHADGDCSDYVLTVLKHIKGASPVLSGNQSCVARIQQDRHGFIEQLNFARCPSEARAPVAHHLFNKQPLPQPKSSDCWQRDIELHLQGD